MLFNKFFKEYENSANDQKVISNDLDKLVLIDLLLKSLFIATDISIAFIYYSLKYDNNFNDFGKKLSISSRKLAKICFPEKNQEEKTYSSGLIQGATITIYRVFRSLEIMNVKDKKLYFEKDVEKIIENQLINNKNRYKDKASQDNINKVLEITSGYFKNNN